MKKIYLDFDSTLNNLIDAWLLWINNKYSTNLSSKDNTSYHFMSNSLGEEADDFWKTQGIYTDGLVTPLEGSIDFVQRLKTIVNEDNVHIITWSPDNMIEEKNKVISEWFDIPNSQIIHTADKHTVTTEGILVDDYPKHVLAHCKHNGLPGIIFNRDGNYGWARPMNYAEDYIPVSHIVTISHDYSAVENCLRFYLDKCRFTC